MDALQPMAEERTTVAWVDLPSTASTGMDSSLYTDGLRRNQYTADLRTLSSTGMRAIHDSFAALVGQCPMPTCAHRASYILVEHYVLPQGNACRFCSSHGIPAPRPGVYRVCVPLLLSPLHMYVVSYTSLPTAYIACRSCFNPTHCETSKAGLGRQQCH